LSLSIFVIFIILIIDMPKINFQMAYIDIF
jgi:hypothetical protein